jgi:hypothetical protein
MTVVFHHGLCPWCGGPPTGPGEFILLRGTTGAEMGVTIWAAASGDIFGDRRFGTSLVPLEAGQRFGGYRDGMRT